MERQLSDARAQPAKAGESGFTLIELMLTASILSIVLLAIFALLDVSARIAPQDQERGQAMRDAEVGLYRMTRELRQAHQVVSGDADTMTVRVLSPGSTSEVTVTYDCGPAADGTARCTRTAGGGPAEVVIDRVINGSRPVFEYDVAPPAVRYVRANIVVPARGGRTEGNGYRHEIIFADGFYMRNRDA